MTLRLVWSAPPVSPAPVPGASLRTDGRFTVPSSERPATRAAPQPRATPSQVPERKRISIYELQDLFEGSARGVHLVPGSEP